MRFCQLDRITELVSGERLKAVRTLRADESYLQDHFPFFPVMPGVLMLEALFQAASWLVREKRGFHGTLVMLKEVNNAKFADFVQPGETLEIEVEYGKEEGNTISIKASGSKGGAQAVSARLVLEVKTPGEIADLTQNGSIYADALVKNQWESLASGLAE